MRKIKALLMLACICIAFTVGATVSAFAGINTNNPGGKGLIDNGEINIENFIVNETLAEGATSAYTLQRGNTTYVSSGHTHENGLFSHTKGIPAADVVDGAKITYQFDVYDWENYWNSVVRMSFFNNSIWQANTPLVQIRFDAFVVLSAPEGAKLYIADDQGNLTESANMAGANYDAGFNYKTLNSIKAKGYDYATFWLELDVAEKSISFYAGNAGANEKRLYSVLTNAYAIPEHATYFSSFAFACSTAPNEIDNFKVYGVKDGVETVYEYYTFDKEETLNAWYGAGGGTFKTYDNAVLVNDPATDTSINSINRLKVDTKLDKTFELSTAFKFDTLVATRKVGLALGLDDYDTALSAPKNGASFLYFTVDADGKVVFGADAIAEDGTATAIGTPNVTDIKLGDKVVVEVVGNKDGSVTATVNGTAYNFANVNANGHFSFAQTGTGAVVYSIYPDEFAVTGYFLTENEGVAESATFDANYINGVKFATQYTIAPSEYVTKQETTVGEIDGLTTAGNRLNFRGTSTNTRVTFANPYADFVFQFDYISEPFATRAIPGGLPTAGAVNRYSPLYVLFGSEQTISELKQTYALGIIEGNATQYFWGAESLLISEGKLGAGTATVLSTATDATEDYDAPINGHYINADTKEVYTKAIMPNTAVEAGYKYSFYNKTTRCKLVVVNNNVRFFVAEVKEDGTVGEYILAYTKQVPNSFGYVGFGTDAPSWCAVDNVAITPIDTATAISLGLAPEITADIVADVAVADMETDVEPTPIAKTTVNVDVETKKISWTAVEGALNYEVTVSLNNEAVLEQTVEGLELDISSLTAYGDYKVAVKVVPADPELHLASRATAEFTLVDPNAAPSDPEPAPSGSCGGSMSAIGLGAIALVLGAFFAKRREN